METLKKYSIFIIAVIVIIFTLIFDQPKGIEAVTTVASSFKEMLFILPPVFIFLGLLDVWVPRDTMVRFMGEGSGLVGFLLAFFLGSAAAGPLYVVFPIAAAFMKKDVSFFNIMVLIGAWSTTKIPMLLFEYGSMGPRFMITRLSMNIPIIIIIAVVMKLMMKDDEVEAIYDNAKSME